MNNETRKRIESINNGKAPAGYKKTKVGIVPEDWEVSEIGKQLVEYRELSNDIEQYPVYSSSRKGLMPQSDYYDKKDAVQTNLGYKMVPVGYATYRHMSDDDIFHFNINLTESTILVSCEYPVFTTKQTTNQYFVITSLNETARFRYFCRTQKLGGTRTRLYFSNLAKYKLALPPLPEQQKIAEILTAQDAVIALMQKQIELLQKQKKAFLQKMFPKKGSNVPEIRFAGFTDAWEQRKVGETYNVTRGYVLAAPKTSPIKTDEMPYPVYSSQTKDEGLMGYYNEYLYENAITWTTDGANAGTVNYRAGKFYCTNVCGVLLSDKGYANKAAAEALNMIAWKWVSHVGNPKLMNNVMAEIEISLPPTLQEQDKISEFLESLDTLITLHQRKLEIEQQKKKALMQLLLTGKVRVKT